MTYHRGESQSGEFSQKGLAAAWCPARWIWFFERWGRAGL